MLESARRRLHRSMVEFAETMTGYFPSIASLLQSKSHAIDPSHPEQTPLPLPSLFVEHERNSCGLQDASLVERRLREGQAHDYLEEVRTRILTYNHIVAVKKINVTGQHQHTRAQSMLRTQMNGARDATRLYNYSRQCLVTLGMPDDNSPLKELKENELWCRNLSKARHLGSNVQDPWYWTMGQSESVGQNSEDGKWKMESEPTSFYVSRVSISNIAFSASRQMVPRSSAY